MTNSKSRKAASAVPMFSISGSDMAGFEVRAMRAAVVYGEESRVVLHIHHAVTLGMNKPPSDKDMEARALKLAASEFERRGIEVAEKVKALAVDPNALLAGVEYAVDETGRKLVPISPPRARRTADAPAAPKRESRR